MKNVKVVKDFDFWASKSVCFAYKAGLELKVLEAHVAAGVEAGAFEVIEDAKEAKPVGHKPG